MKNKKNPIILTITLLLFLAACQPIIQEENLLTGRATTTSSGEEKTVTSPAVNIVVKDLDDDPSEQPDIAPIIGWGAETRGAWGHPDVVSGKKEPEVYRVTNLNRLGPGSFRYGVWDDPTLRDNNSNRVNGRIIVFEVGGVIDMRGSGINIRSYITIAGQTAPSPGITVVNTGALRIDDASNIIFQHLTVRPGQGDREIGSGWQPDGIVISHGQNILIDQSTFSWYIDQGMTIRATHGWLNDEEELKQAVSHNITLSNNIMAEGLHNSSHPKGPHSMASLIAGRSWNVLLARNLMIHNDERHPHWSGGGGQTILLNNMIYNWGNQGSAPSLSPDYPHVVHEHSLIGNYYQAGVNSNLNGGPLRLGGSSAAQPVHFYLEDNIALNRDGNAIPFAVAPAWFNWDLFVELDEPPYWYPGLEDHILSAEEVELYLAENVGARHWDRDPIDQRIIQEMLDKTGNIIDHEDEREGIPDYEPNQRDFDMDEWFWWDGGKDDGARRILLNKETNNYYHKNDKKT